jgi:hypothetical protein
MKKDLIIRVEGDPEKVEAAKKAIVEELRKMGLEPETETADNEKE